MEVDINKIRILAESAERRAHAAHEEYSKLMETPDDEKPTYTKAANYLNDFFYWSGYKNAYRGIVAMAEMQAIVEDELDNEATCP